MVSLFSEAERPNVSRTSLCFLVDHMNVTVGKYSLGCRFICSALVVGPLIYRISVEEGDAYHFLALVLLAPLAGFVLLLNSLFCLYRYRTWESAGVSLIFIPVSAIGIVVAWHFLPQFRM